LRSARSGWSGHWKRWRGRGLAAPAKSRRNWDAYAAVIASLVGLLALGISGYTAYVQRQHLRAQVWPHLRLSYSGVNVSLSARNEGSGPARIVAVRVTMDRVPVKSWKDIREAAGFGAEFHFHMSTIHDGVLLSGTVVDIAKGDGGEQSLSKFAELFPGGTRCRSPLATARSSTSAGLPGFIRAGSTTASSRPASARSPTASGSRIDDAEAGARRGRDGDLVWVAFPDALKIAVVRHDEVLKQGV
jgi:hypothetical protein